MVREATSAMQRSCPAGAVRRVVHVLSPRRGLLEVVGDRLADSATCIAHAPWWSKVVLCGRASRTAISSNAGRVSALQTLQLKNRDSSGRSVGDFVLLAKDRVRAKVR